MISVDSIKILENGLLITAEEIQQINAKIKAVVESNDFAGDAAGEVVSIMQAIVKCRVRSWVGGAKKKTEPKFEQDKNVAISALFSEYFEDSEALRNIFLARISTPFTVDVDASPNAYFWLAE